MIPSCQASSVRLGAVLHRPRGHPEVSLEHATEVRRAGVANPGCCLAHCGPAQLEAKPTRHDQDSASRPSRFCISWPSHYRPRSVALRRSPARVTALALRSTSAASLKSCIEPIVRGQAASLLPAPCAMRSMQSLRKSAFWFHPSRHVTGTCSCVS